MKLSNHKKIVESKIFEKRCNYFKSLTVDKKIDYVIRNWDQLDIRNIIASQEWSEDVQLALINIDGGDLFSCLKNPTIKVQLTAVRNNGSDIDAIQNPLPMIQWAAFKNDPASIWNIRPITCILPEIVEEYNKWADKNPSYLKFIVETNIFESLEHYGDGQPDFDDLGEDEQIEFIKQNLEDTEYDVLINVLCDAKYISERVQLAAVKLKPDLIICFNDTSISVQLEAVKRDGTAIFHMWKPSPMIQAVACKQDPEAVNLIDPIEVTDINLLKKYRSALGFERQEYLKQLEKKSTLTESKYAIEDGYFKTGTFKGKWALSFNDDTWREDDIIDFIKDFYQDGSTNNADFLLFDEIMRSSDLSERVQLELVEIDAYGLNLIEKPSIRVQLAAVNNNGLAISEIYNPLPMIQWAAVKNNYNAIWEINPRLSVIADVKTYYNTWAKEQFTRRLFVESKQYNSLDPNTWSDQQILDYISERAERIKTVNDYITEVNEIRRLVKRLDSANESLIKAIVKIEPGCFELFAEKFPISIPLQIWAVQYADYMIDYIKDPAPLVQWAAVSANRSALFCMNIKKLDPTIREKYRDFLINNDLMPAEFLEESIDGEIANQISHNEQHLVHQLSELYHNYHHGLTLNINYWDCAEGLIKKAQPISKPCQIQLVSICGGLLRYLNSDDLDICMVAVMNTSSSLMDVPNKTIPIQLAAVNKSGYSIIHVKNPSPMIQAAACRRNSDAINFITPIESTDINLMKKYRNALAWDRLKYLENIEQQEKLMESNTGMTSEEQDLLNTLTAKYRDLQNGQITQDFYEFSTKNNIVKMGNEWQPTVAFMNNMALIDPLLLRFFKTIPEEVSLTAIEQADAEDLNYLLSFVIMDMTIRIQYQAVNKSPDVIELITDPVPMVQAMACLKNPRLINEIHPIGCIENSLLIKYKKYLTRETRKELEKIEQQENLTESRLKSGEFGIEYWIPSPHQAKFELNQNTNLFDRERNKEGLVKRTATATIEAIQNQFECTLNNITKGTGPTITAAIYDTLPKAAKYLTWHRK